MRLLAIALLAFTMVLLLQPSSAQDKKEPVHEGKTLSQWVAQLKDADVKKRLAAVKAVLGFERNDEPTLGAILAAAKDFNAEVRTAAVNGLYRLPKTKEAKATLLEALKDPTAEVRRRAAFALVGFAPEAKDVVPPLIGALKDKDPYVPSFAAHTLGEFGLLAKDAAPALLKIIKAPPAEAFSPQEKSQKRLWIASAFALGRITSGSNVAVGSLVALLRHQAHWHDVATSAAVALGSIGPAANEAVTPLQETLKTDKSGTLRLFAAASLARIDPKFTKSSVALLIEALRDKDDLVRFNAFSALGGMGPRAKDAVPALMNALKDKNPSIRTRAGETLQMIDPAAAKKAAVR